MRELLQSLLGDALAAARDAGELELAETTPVVVEKPREQGHGDLACNVAMLLARSERKPPRKIAETLAAQINDPRIESVEVAGPGFINVTFSAAAWRERLCKQRHWRYSRSTAAADRNPLLSRPLQR